MVQLCREIRDVERRLCFLEALRCLRLQCLHLQKPCFLRVFSGVGWAVV